MDQNKNIQQMQFLEQNLQAILMQKQAYQMELSETITALKEIENSGEEIYKIIGQLMLKTNSKKVKEELKNKEKILETRMKALENQEKSLTEQANKIRQEILKSMKKE